MRAVLMYHSLDDSGSVLSVPPRSFQAHLATMQAEGVRVRPLEELVADTTAPVGPEVALTFDDGFANLADTAFPLLADYGYPATVFVVSSHAGGDNRWGGRQDSRIPVLPLLSWEQLGRAAAAGITIGSHTRSHPHLGSLTEAQATDEVRGCIETIARELGVQVTSLAYPFGDPPPAPATVCAASGVRVACTTVHRPLQEQDDRLAIPRLDAWYYRAPDALHGFGSRTFRTAVRARWALRAARRLFRGD